MVDVEKVIKGLEELREYADREIHPIVSPDNWSIYSGLRDLIDGAENDALALLKERYVPDCNAANHDGNGCLGYGYSANDDEPIPICRDCKKYTSYVEEQ